MKSEAIKINEESIRIYYLEEYEMRPKLTITKDNIIFDESIKKSYNIRVTMRFKKEWMHDDTLNDDEVLTSKRLMHTLKNALKKLNDDTLFINPHRFNEEYELIYIIPRNEIQNINKNQTVLDKYLYIKIVIGSAIIKK